MRSEVVTPSVAHVRSQKTHSASDPPSLPSEGKDEQDPVSTTGEVLKAGTEEDAVTVAGYRRLLLLAMFKHQHGDSSFLNNLAILFEKHDLAKEMLQAEAKADAKKVVDAGVLTARGWKTP